MIFLPFQISFLDKTNRTAMNEPVFDGVRVALLLGLHEQVDLLLVHEEEVALGVDRLLLHIAARVLTRDARYVQE